MRVVKKSPVLSIGSVTKDYDTMLSGLKESRDKITAQINALVKEKFLSESAYKEGALVKVRNKTKPAVPLVGIIEYGVSSLDLPVWKFYPYKKNGELSSKHNIVLDSDILSPACKEDIPKGEFTIS